jgi:hypothetical protein
MLPRAKYTQLVLPRLEQYHGRVVSIDHYDVDENTDGVYALDEETENFFFVVKCMQLESRELGELLAQGAKLDVSHEETWLQLTEEEHAVTIAKYAQLFKERGLITGLFWDTLRENHTQFKKKDRLVVIEGLGMRYYVTTELWVEANREDAFVGR